MKFSAVLSLVVLACLIAAPSFSVGAEGDKPADSPAEKPADSPADKPADKAVSKPALATIEQQIEFLEGALGEGLGSLDWKMAELAVEGYKKTGLSGDALEVSLLRAERCALIEQTGAGGGNLGPQVMALGMAVRAQMGDAKALPALKAWANDDIPSVKPPDQAMFKDQGVEAIKQEKAYEAFTRAVKRRGYAILGLALLKEPGIGDRALAALKNPTTQAASGGGIPQTVVIGGPGGPGGPGGGRGARPRGTGSPDEPLVLAVVAADAQAGLKSLLDFCADDKTTLLQSATVLNSLARMAPGTKARQGADEPFSLEADIGAQLPPDIFTQLAAPLTAALKRWKPDDQNQNPMAMMRSFAPLTSLLSAANDFPPKSLPAEGVTALQDLKAKIPAQAGRFVNGQIDGILKKQGADPAAAQKPPTPPKDF